MAKWARRGGRYYRNVINLCSLSKVGQNPGELGSHLYYTGWPIAETVEEAVDELTKPGSVCVNVPNDATFCAQVRERYAQAIKVEV